MTMRVRAQIGFTSEPEKVDTRKVAEELVNEAAAILLYQSALKTTLSQSFLKVLVALSKETDANKLLQCYGDFYSAMAQAGHTSWQDYLLDRVLSGGGCALAERTERGLSASALHAAARADLDALQKLAVAEATLVGLVVEQRSTGVGNEWAQAAASLGGRGDHTRTAAAEAEAADVDVTASFCEDEGAALGALAAPLSAAARQAWRAHVGGQWRWSDALPGLLHCYHQHGAGVVGANASLLWKDGTLKAAAAAEAAEDVEQLGVLGSKLFPTVAAAAANNAARHLACLPAAHALLHSADAAAVTAVAHHTLRDAQAAGLRVVTVPTSELTTLPKLWAVLAQHPRARFVLLLHVGVRVSDTSAEVKAVTAALSASASAAAANAPPANALMYVVSLDAVDSAGLRSEVGVTWQLGALDQEQYAEAVAHLAEASGTKVAAAEVQADIPAQPSVCGDHHDHALTVQRARQLVAARRLADMT